MRFLILFVFAAGLGAPAFCTEAEAKKVVFDALNAYIRKNVSETFLEHEADFQKAAANKNLDGMLSEFVKVISRDILVKAKHQCQTEVRTMGRSEIGDKTKEEIETLKMNLAKLAAQIATTKK